MSDNNDKTQTFEFHPVKDEKPQKNRSENDEYSAARRNKSYEKACKTIDDIFNMLNKEVGFNPQQSPFYLGRNENDYAEFSVNYIVYIETKEGEMQNVSEWNNFSI